MWGLHVYRVSGICTVWFSLFASFYPFYVIIGSGQSRKRLGEASRMVVMGVNHNHHFHLLSRYLCISLVQVLAK